MSVAFAILMSAQALPDRTNAAEKTMDDFGDTYPLYLLRFEGKWQVIFPETKEDIGHTDFWEQTVSFLVAQHYKIPQKKLANLPYCQRRARIAGDIIWYGGKSDADLLKAIRKALGNKKLEFQYDDHERRLKEDVSGFKRLVAHYAVNVPNLPTRKPS